MSDNLDLFASVKARDEGLEKVAENNNAFMASALELISYLSPSEYMGEDIAYACKVRGIIPSHPNAFGALIKLCVKRGILQETGRWQKARSVKNHASRYPVYRKA